MTDQGEGRNYDLPTVKDPLNASLTANSTTLSPTALLSPSDVKIEMVQPKVEMVDLDGDHNLAGHIPTLNDVIDAKTGLTLTVGQGSQSRNRTARVRSYENENDLRHQMKFSTSKNEINKFKCFHCFFKTKRKDSLKNHVETQHVFGETDRTNCPQCWKSFKNKDSMRKHVSVCGKLSSEIVKHKCSHCLYETKWKKNLTRHIIVVHPVDVIDRPICTGCGKSCKNSDCLRQHMRMCDKTNNEIVKHKCPDCLYVTKWKSALTQHLKRSHSMKTKYRSYDTLRKQLEEHPRELTSGDVVGEGVLDSKADLPHLIGQERLMGTGFCMDEDDPKCYLNYPENSTNEMVKFKCFHCSQETKWKRSLKRHIETRHLIDMYERQNCPGCGKSLKNKYGLTQHTRYCEKLNDEIEKHECPICFFKTKWKQQLRAHIKRIHSVEIPDASICSKCGRSYKSESALNSHLKYCGKSKHEVVKFRCFHCAHETKWKRNLRMHIESRHLAHEMVRQTCPGCGKSLKSKSGLRLHVKYCEKSNSKIVKHECPICYYKTKWKGDLKGHMRRIHSVETSDVSICPGCGKYSSNNDCLKQHMRFCDKMNITIVKHKCSLCFFETKWTSALKKHIRKMHSVETPDRLTCTGCGKSHKSKPALELHMKLCETLVKARTKPINSVGEAPERTFFLVTQNSSSVLYCLERQDD